MRTPRAFSFSRLAWVAAFSHIFTFMAGATTTGAVVATKNVDRKSTPNPFPNLPRVPPVSAGEGKSPPPCRLGCPRSPQGKFSFFYFKSQTGWGESNLLSSDCAVELLTHRLCRG